MKRAHSGLLFVGVLALLTSMTVLAAADDAREEEIRKYHKQIAGTWQMVTLVANGNKSADEDVKKLTVMNGPDGMWSLHSEGNVIVSGTTTVDPTQNPKAIDIKPATGQDQGKVYLGIYELKDNTRKLCFSPAGTKRPTAFTSTPGDEWILVEFERVKPQPK